jgi:predicted dehydrogenase
MIRRREFLGGAAAFLAASRMARAQDPVNVAVIGLGGRGNDHMMALSRIPSARIAAVCDVNQEARERGAALVEKLTGSKPKMYADMRRVFDDRGIQAVSMATPNHWHALGTIWACQAGKDVYVEKPVCHNVFEGRKMLEAAAKYQRVVQAGSQGRSIPYRHRAIQHLHNGAIGKVYLAKGLCYKRRVSIGRKPAERVPAGIDWDLFLGPAPMRPFTWNRYKYNWHWFWETGNGDIGNQGVHEMDFARWGLGKDLPSAAVSTGGKYVYDDEQETPNTQLATYDYGDCELVFEVRGLPTEAESGILIGNLFYGSDGYMAMDQSGFRIYQGEEKKLAIEEKIDPSEAIDTIPHFTNFLDAVRTRDRGKINGRLDEGVKSACLCHLANISYRVGRRLAWDGEAWSFGGDAEANALLTRAYRAPFVVPAKV